MEGTSGGGAGGTSTRRSRPRRGQSVFSKNMEEAARALYHCNYCHRDISDNIRIKCAVCPDFDLCVECFAVGVEVMGHSNGHSYRVVDNLSFPILHPAWGSDEELLLLEAVEIYGLGNWAAVAEHVGTKSTQECLSHYYQIYIDPPSCPLPTPAPEMAGLDVKKLADVAKRSCGRKRMKLDASSAAAQLKQLLHQDGGAGAGGSAGGSAGGAAAGGGGQESQQEAQVKLEQEQQQQHNNAISPAAAAAAGGPSPMQVDNQQQHQQQHQQQQQVDVKSPPVAGAAAAAGDGQVATSPRQQGHAKVSFRQRAADEAAAAAAAATTADAAAAAAAQQQQLSALSPRKAATTTGDAIDGAAAAAAAANAAGAAGLGGLTPAAGAAAAAAGGKDGGALAAAAAGADGAPRVKGSGPQLDQMTGWHHKRFEFEPEWDNDAESAIAEIEFKESDSPEEEAAKLLMLEIYNKRLDERERRRAFILDHGLLNVRRMQGSEKRRLPGEREKHAQMRVFARYLPPGCHETFVEGLLLEGRLRLRIAELQAHRALGRRTLAEVEEAESAEAAAKKKAKEKALRDAMLSGMTLLQGQQEAESSVGQSGPATLGGYRSTASALSMYRQRQGYGLDISAVPGHEVLTNKEAELCAAARLLPTHYLTLKDNMMRDAQVHGHITRTDARGFFRLDSSRSARVWEVLCASGWLKDTNPEEAEMKKWWVRKAEEQQQQAAAPPPPPRAPRPPSQRKPTQPVQPRGPPLSARLQQQQALQQHQMQQQALQAQQQALQAFKRQQQAMQALQQQQQAQQQQQQQPPSTPVVKQLTTDAAAKSLVAGFPRVTATSASSQSRATAAAREATAQAMAAAKAKAQAGAAGGGGV